MGVEQLMQRLEQWDKWPAAWDPEAPGEIIAGKVLEYTTGESPYGRCHVVVMDVQGRQIGGRKTSHPARLAVWLSKEVLFREFRKQRPQVGELIALKYVGPPDKDNAYHQYKLIVDRIEQASELEPLGGERDEGEGRPPKAAAAGAGSRPRFNPPQRQPVDDGLGVSQADMPRQRPLANGVLR
jgi:hypothetical protein